MLRLWPEEIQIGLFDDHCWLRLGASGPVRQYPFAYESGASGLLEVLEKMLGEPDNHLPDGSTVVITVSDTLAAICVLPWQATLRRPDEVRRYAGVLFERAGRTIDSAWVMRADFLRYGAAGLAFAFPRDWLAEVQRIVTGHAKQLSRILPASVAAHELSQSLPREGQQLFLLTEQGRVTALITSQRGLDHFDVEPVTAANEAAMLRLIRRATVQCTKVEKVMHWSSMPGAMPMIEHRLKAELPASQIVALAQERLC